MDETRPPFNGFARAGEAAVQHAVDAGHYSLGEAASARAWLAWRTQERRREDQARSDASQAANLEVATSAKDAAWVAAEAARDAAREAKRANQLAASANRIAALALLAAAIAIIVSVIGLLHH